MKVIKIKLKGKDKRREFFPVRKQVRPTLRIMSYESFSSATSLLNPDGHVFEGQRSVLENSLMDKLSERLGNSFANEFPTHDMIIARKSLLDNKVADGMDNSL